ncbi:MAG: FtsB family cell division protein [Actinomycetota bacterium]
MSTRKKARPRRRPPARRKPPSRQKQPRRLGIVPQLIALMLVLGLAGAMAVQPTRQLFAQRDRISEMSGDLKKVNKSNKALNDRIDRLNDPDYLEQVARDSGYARPGETVYNVVPPSRKELKRQEKRRAHKSRPAPQPDPGFMERFLNFVGLG